MEGVIMKDKKRKNYWRCERGFTLIELMVVMIILGLLAALVVPKMFGRIGEAKQKAAYAQIQLFGTALDSFRLDVGRYPTTAEGLEALIKPPAGVEGWNGPYLKKSEIPLDPWNRPYHYESPGKHGDYDLYSYGADNAEGGEGENRDIVSWKSLR
jgi:general secretion pathway protein G